eukprot:scaffold66019_cov64-Phaeocystis_antarctica.AAC.2
MLGSVTCILQWMCGHETGLCIVCNEAHLTKQQLPCSFRALAGAAWRRAAHEPGTRAVARRGHRHGALSARQRGGWLGWRDLPLVVQGERVVLAARHPDDRRGADASADAHGRPLHDRAAGPRLVLTELKPPVRTEHPQLPLLVDHCRVARSRGNGGGESWKLHFSRCVELRRATSLAPAQLSEAVPLSACRPGEDLARKAQSDAMVEAAARQRLDSYACERLCVHSERAISGDGVLTSVGVLAGWQW